MVTNGERRLVRLKRTLCLLSTVVRPLVTRHGLLHWAGFISLSVYYCFPFLSFHVSYSYRTFENRLTYSVGNE